MSRKRARRLRDAVPYVGRNWTIGGGGGFENARKEMRDWRMKVGFGPFRRTGPMAPAPSSTACVAKSPKQVYAFVRGVMPGADMTYGFVREEEKVALFRDPVDNTWLHFELGPHPPGLQVCCNQKRTSYAEGRKVNHDEMSKFLRNLARP